MYAKAKIIRILKNLIANQETCEVIAIANLNLEELEHGDFSSMQNQTFETLYVIKQ